MPRRPVSTRVAPAPARAERRWPWWSIVSAHNQNMTADLELARVRIANLSGTRLRGADRDVFRSCQNLLAKCLASHRRTLFKNRIYVRQSLCVIFQNLILIEPREALRASWLTIRQRLGLLKDDNDSSAAKFDAAAIKAIDDVVARNRGVSGPDERIAREMMKEIRAYLDEKLVSEYWNGVALQQKTNLAAAFGLVSLILFLWAWLCESNNCTLSMCIPALCRPDPTKHGLFATICAGVLGGAISTIARPRAVSDDGGLPMVRLTLIRPLLGGMAGAFLYLIAYDTRIVFFTYPYLYPAAIAFGFSEHALTDALSASANKVGTALNKGIGQPASENEKPKKGK